MPWAEALRRVRSASRVSLRVVDCHCGGEPARVVVDGLPPVAGNTMLEKRATMMRDHDNLRALLIHEPRGYPCQNVNFIFKRASGVRPPVCRRLRTAPGPGSRRVTLALSWASRTPSGL